MGDEDNVDIPCHSTQNSGDAQYCMEGSGDPAVSDTCPHEDATVQTARELGARAQHQHECETQWTKIIAIHT